MARAYPRFLFSNPQNTKSKGPFIVHLLEPKIICRIAGKEEATLSQLHYISVSGWVLLLVDVLEQNYDAAKVQDCMYNMLTWATKQKEVQDLFSL